MARRGRQRKPGPREINGRPQRRGRDRGTKEIQSLREWYAGKGDPALAAYPLGILLVNEAISDAQHSAGCGYAWLHWAVFGRVSVGAVSYEFMDRAKPIERDRAHEERKLEAILELFQGDRRGRRGLDGLVIFERIPRWMRPVDPRLGDISDARVFMAALETLEDMR